MARRISKKSIEKTSISNKAETNKLLKLKPDELPITAKRAEYLARMAKVSEKNLIGKPLKEVHEILKWKIDPDLFHFRRVCGKVVKRDPMTGGLEAVPNATVHVEDTDCNFWGYFPKKSRWGWLYPLFCTREEIATVTTNECGEFCVYLPYWDIDRILTLRKRLICMLFYRPILRDIVELPPEPIFREPRLTPEISLFAPKRLSIAPAIRQKLDTASFEHLEMAVAHSLSSGDDKALNATLDTPVFTKPVPPPLPQEVLKAKGDIEKLSKLMSFNMNPRLLNNFRPSRFIGPYLRCWEVLMPVWTPILDVPDITLRVTQDYDLDGVEENIYSESFFDVRWNSGSIMDVVLEANGNALSTPHCHPASEIPCKDKPSIESAGYMDLESAYHDNVTGYAKKVNRPTEEGKFPENDDRVSPATAPYAGNVNLHGCFRTEEDATHYRVTRSFRVNEDEPWGPHTPITGITWTAPRQGEGAPIPFVPDANGWYEILPAEELVHSNWILPWRTWQSPGDGCYQLRLEIGKLQGGTIHKQKDSAVRTFVVDNSNPSAVFELVQWRYASDNGPWTTVLPTGTEDTCPIIEREEGRDIHIQVTWTAGATHLRDAILDQYGCGGGNMELVSTGTPAEFPLEEEFRHWHTGPDDNTVHQTNVFLLSSTRPPGCYTIRIRTNSRAFNPQDWDAASTYDWEKDQIFKWKWIHRAISVVNI